MLALAIFCSVTQELSSFSLKNDVTALRLMVGNDLSELSKSIGSGKKSADILLILPSPEDVGMKSLFTDTDEHVGVEVIDPFAACVSVGNVPELVIHVLVETEELDDKIFC